MPHPSGQTVWQSGEPARTDSLAILKSVPDSALPLEPDTVLLPVAEVVREAVRRFGQADSHDVETHFDRLVLDLEGARTGEPAAYLVQIDRLLG